MKEPAKIKCNKCDSIYELKKAENFLRKDKNCICKKCINNHSGGRLTLEDFQNKINGLYPEEKLEVLNYTLKNEPCSIKCLECGEIYTLKHAESFYNKDKKRVCSKCISNKSEQINKKYQEFLKYINDSEKFIYINDNYERITSKTLISCKCTSCGKINKKTIYDYLSGRGCTCLANNQKMTNEQYQDFIGDEYTLLSDYQGKEKSVMIRHNLCGFCYKKNARYYHCPKCTGSNGEKTISFLLNSYNIDYIKEYKVTIDEHDLRFDFYIPDYNLYIEYQGEQHVKPVPYFGGEDGFKKQQKYDALKKEWINNNHYNFLEIYYNENIESKISKYLLKFNGHPEKE